MRRGWVLLLILLLLLLLGGVAGYGVWRSAGGDGQGSADSTVRTDDGAESSSATRRRERVQPGDDRPESVPAPEPETAGGAGDVEGRDDGVVEGPVNPAEPGAAPDGGEDAR